MPSPIEPPSAGADESAAAPAPAPRSPAHLFWAFNWLALQGFGGVMAVVQRELVERKRWMTREQFVEDWAVAQTLPGPNVCNLALMIGDRAFGLRGALAALAGLLVAPLAVVLAMLMLFTGLADDVTARGALRGMGAVAAGLLAATGIKLGGALRRNVMGPAACVLFGVAAFVAVAVLRLPMIAVIPVLGGLACGWAYHRLAPDRARSP